MTIDVSSLDYKPSSCCGQHMSASVQMPDGASVIVNKGPDGDYQVMRIRNGLLIGGISTSLTKDAANALIQTFFV
jgi:hypothetical protein